MLVRAACLFIPFSLLQGCAYLDPYVSIKPSQHQVPVSANLPQVARTALYLDERTIEVAEKGLQFGREHRRLNLLTFGLATAATMAPVYKAHRDLIAGLSMGAAVSYASNSLFSPSSMGDLYDAAVVSLICIRGKAAILSAEVSNAIDSEGIDRLKPAYESLTCASPESRDEIDEAYGTVSALARRAVRSDSLASEKLRQAGVATLSALNREISARLPSAEAILAAAKATSAGVAPAAASSSTPTAGVTAFSTEVCDETAEVLAESRKDVILKEFEKVSLGITAALDGIEGLDKGCALNVAQVPELVVDRDAVTVAQGSEVYVRVSGGRPPYRSTWETTPRAGDVTRQDVPEFVILRGSAQIGADGSYKLIVRDSSPVARVKTITVTAKKPSAA